MRQGMKVFLPGTNTLAFLSITLGDGDQRFIGLTPGRAASKAGKKYKNRFSQLSQSQDSQNSSFDDASF
jgi:hypothetical protein